LSLAKLPTIKELQDEYNALVAEKLNCKEVARKLNQNILNLQSARENCEMILGVGRETSTPTKKYEHEI
jgi:hypothetical protein